jgi:hypothetical protein
MGMTIDPGRLEYAAGVVISDAVEPAGGANLLAARFLGPLVFIPTLAFFVEVRSRRHVALTRKAGPPIADRRA